MKTAEAIDTELTDEFFERVGFDISKEPFIRELPDGSKQAIFKNYIGDGRYEGYTLIEPVKTPMKTVKEFYHR